MKDTKGCRLGRGKSWMGQAEDSILQVCQLTAQAHQGVGKGKLPKLIPASLRHSSRGGGGGGGELKNNNLGKQAKQRSSFLFKKTANRKTS